MLSMNLKNNQHKEKQSMKRICMNIAAACLICVTALVYAGFQDGSIEALLKQHPDNVSVLMQAAEYFLDRASCGEQNALCTCVECLEKVLNKEPRNGEAMAYLGSARTIQAQYAKRQQDKIEYMQKGLAKLDKAAALYPDNPVIRLTRGTTYSNIPSFFNRLDTAVQDFRHVQTMQEQQDLHLPAAYWAPFYFNFGNALQAAGDSVQAAVQFHKVMEIAPGHRLAAQARRKIESGE